MVSTQIQNIYYDKAVVQKIYYNNIIVYSIDPGLVLQIDPYSDYVTLLLRGNDQIISQFNPNPLLASNLPNWLVDSSTFFAVTTTNRLTLSINGKYDGAVSLVGAIIDPNQVLTFTNVTLSGIDNFTIEGWYNLGLGAGASLSVPIALFGIEGQIIDSSNFYIGIDTNLYPYFARGENIEFSSSTSVSPSDWFHIALVKTKINITDSNYKLFLNGKLVGQKNLNAEWNNNKLFISGTVFPLFNSLGSFDEFRVTKGVARYTTNFIPGQFQVIGDSNYSNVIFLGKYDLNTLSFSDASLDRHLVTGNRVVSNFTKKFNNALSFVGNTSNLYTEVQIEDLDLDGDFTIETWISSTSPTYSIFDSIGRDEPIGSPRWYLCVVNSNLIFGFNNIELTGELPSTDLTGWQHIAVTRESGIIRMFINGKQFTTPYSYGETLSGGGATNELLLGITLLKNTPGIRAVLDGYLEEPRITKGHCRYTEDFLPPTAPFSDIGSFEEGKNAYSGILDGCEGYWSFNESVTAATYSPNNLVLEAISVSFDDEGNSIPSTPIDQGFGIFNNRPDDKSVLVKDSLQKLWLKQSFWNQYSDPSNVPDWTISVWINKTGIYSISPESENDYPNGDATLILGSFFGEMGFGLHGGLAPSDSFVNIPSNFVVDNNITLSVHQFNDVNLPLYIGNKFQFPVNKWIHCGIVHSKRPDSKRFTLYINGRMHATKEYSTLGAYLINPDNPFNSGIVLNGSPTGDVVPSVAYGSVYEFNMFGLWTRALKQSEILQLYTDPLGVNAMFEEAGASF